MQCDRIEKGRLQKATNLGSDTRSVADDGVALNKLPTCLEPEVSEFTVRP